MYRANSWLQVIKPQLARLSDQVTERIDWRSLLVTFTFVVLSANAWATKKCTVEQHKADRARMVTATKEGILKADPESGRHGIALSAFVSEAAWVRMRFAEKVDFAESLVCAWAGVDKGILVLNLRSDMTGHVIGEWRVNRLTVPSTVPSFLDKEGTPKGSGFSCDPVENVCRCEGVKEDCAAMKKNCSGELKCELTGGVSLCTCKMLVFEPTQRVPMGKKPSRP
jgi:hypothetical protein